MPSTVMLMVPIASSGLVNINVTLLPFMLVSMVNVDALARMLIIEDAALLLVFTSFRDETTVTDNELFPVCSVLLVIVNVAVSPAPRFPIVQNISPELFPAPTLPFRVSYEFII